MSNIWLTIIPNCKPFKPDFWTNAFYINISQIAEVHGEEGLHFLFHIVQSSSISSQQSAISPTRFLYGRPTLFILTVHNTTDLTFQTSFIQTRVSEQLQFHVYYLVLSGAATVSCRVSRSLHFETVLFSLSLFLQHFLSTASVCLSLAMFYICCTTSE